MRHLWHYLTQWAPGLRVGAKNRYSCLLDNNNTQEDTAITALDPDLSVLIFNGFYSSAFYFRKGICTFYLYDEETVRCESDYGPGVLYARVQTLSFISGLKRIQRGEIQITNGNTYGDDTVDEFVPAKTIALYGGSRHATEDPKLVQVFIETIGSTTVRAYRYGSTGTTTVRYELLEWE